jgi:flagellar protein FliS
MYCAPRDPKTGSIATRFRRYVLWMSYTKPDSQAYRDYIESRVLSARPVEIVSMLYEVAIDNLNIAIGCLKAGDIFGRSKAVSKAQSAVHELMSALDPKVNASIARNLAELYDYAQRRIIAGHTRRSEQALKDALGVLSTLSEGWAGVRANVMGSAAPQMDGDGQSLVSTGTATRHLYAEHLYAEPARLPATARDWSC